ncbi:hypothetical protein Sphch_2546 [Sphingobium chlorophenolicum L-1]|uniref:Uncharacterized protein n=1 Tax=Sphingobium chlorophenolicum L-1 TaxID=690566 RepID=F6EZA1_SPHCR|nr:hypothetical protein [Sphingobium chlorophenolicum]AEG50194.1 hypothetical protein Sphch_2546 [Sphingobium chlorophenolicum L-1]
MIISFIDERFELVDTDNFRELKLAATAPLPPRMLKDQLGRIDGDHVWVGEPWFLAQPCAESHEWVGLFRQMKEYASGMGWVDSSGAIRVHIETSHDESITG